MPVHLETVMIVRYLQLQSELLPLRGGSLFLSCEHAWVKERVIFRPLTARLICSLILPIGPATQTRQVLISDRLFQLNLSQS